MTGSSSSGDDRQDARTRIAADSITRIAEDLLASGTLHYAQLHMYVRLTMFRNSSYARTTNLVLQGALVIQCVVHSFIRNVSKEPDPSTTGRK